MQPARSDRPRPACGAARLRRDPRGRDRARRHGGGAAGGRAHGTPHRPHERRPRLHPQPHPAGLRGLGPLQVECGAVPARAGHADQAEHRRPLRRALRRGPHRPPARLRRRGAGRLRVVRHRSGAVLRERALLDHPHAALLQPGPRPGDRGTADLPGRRAAQGVRAGRRHRGRIRQPSDQLQPALPGRDLPARPRHGCSRHRPRPGGRGVRDGGRHVGHYGGLGRRRTHRTRAPAPAPGLFVLHAGLRADPRALRLGRAGPSAARPDPPRALGRPGHRALRRGARHPGAVRDVRGAAGPAAAAILSPRDKASSFRRRPTTRTTTPSRRWSPPSAPAEPARAPTARLVSPPSGR